MLTNSQKEHLTYTAIGQIVTLFALGVFSYQYIVPGIPEINSLAEKSQASIDSYDSTLKNGINFESLGRLLEGRTERAELIKIIQSDPKETERIITKPPEEGQKEYLDWIKSQIGKSEDDKNILKLEKAKLNSIIPTMSPISSNIEEDSINLRQYVRFIESSILKRFNFDVNVNIGMQGIVFGVPGSNVPENLGMFEFRLDFAGTNRDIINFINYINTAGKPDILSLTGSSVGVNSLKIPEVMSNPLITMESFSLQEKLDADNPNKENKGRVTLKFYVRGVSKDDILFLKENLKARQESLNQGIIENVKLCEKDPIICASYNRKLITFQQKYIEYIRSAENVKILVTGNDEIYGLTQSVNTLKSLEKEFEGIIPKK